MKDENERVLDGLKNKQNNETYGQYCDRLENAIIAIIDRGDTSSTAIEILAFAHMEASADFEYASRHNPRAKTIVFFSQLSPEVKDLFRKHAMALPRGRVDRVNLLLGEL